MREDKVKEWFIAWFDSEWSEYNNVFNINAYYSESWGPEYTGVIEIKEWFNNWHTHSELISWDIKKFYHFDSSTIVEWYFHCRDCKEEHEFDGVSIIEWDSNEKIKSLKEYASSLPKYNPLK